MFMPMKTRIAGASLLVAAAVLGGTVMVQDDADTAQQPQAEQTSDVRLGTFDPQAVFQQSYGFNELMELSQRLQAEAQQAQSEGDQERLMELNQEMQQGQERIINQFQEEIDRIVPEVARENDFDIIALEVVYVQENIGEAEDITEEVVTAINADAPESTEEFAPPAPAPQPSAPETQN